jgi:hypothetical protein
VSRQAGWIAPVVLAAGVVRGTWGLVGSSLQVDWFKEAGAPPRPALRAETKRVSAIFARDLELKIAVAS